MHTQNEIVLTLPALRTFIWQYVKRQKGLFWVIFLLSLLGGLEVTIWPYILRLVIDILTNYEGDRALAWSSLKFPVVYGLCMLVIVEAVFRAKGYLYARAISRVESDIRMDMFEHVQRHSPQYFNEHLAGSLSNKIADMTTQVSLILHHVFWTFMQAFSTIVLGALFFMQINGFFTMLLAGWVVIHFSICTAFAQKCDHYEDLHGQTRTTLMGKIVDSLTNNLAVNLFYRFRYEKASIEPLQNEERKRNFASKKYTEGMLVLLSLAFFAGIISIFGLMLYFWMQDRISTGEVAQIFNLTWNIMMIMWLAGPTIPTFFQAVGIARQALTVMNDPQDVVDVPTAKPLSISSGAVRFDNVSFQYGEKKLFQNKDVEIHGGERVGLVGYSGAGKSTFVNLILRLFPLTSGKILIDGQDIAHVTLESLRKQVALIPQDPLLFHRSLKENILYGKIDADEEEVMQAARLAHCDEFIQKIPNGYDAIVGERGTKLSGGERQRIAIARAILANTPILILDEATSALDSITEKYIQESLDSLMQKRTTIVIAHRLSTLSKMNRIIVFDQGKIVEEGSHSTLLSLGGHYAHMWQMQAGGFLPDKPI